MHRRLYEWVLHWADTPYGAPALFILSLAESSFFPMPPDVLLAPLVLGNRRKWLRFAVICSSASVVGGLAGYAIGMFAWAAVGDVFFDYVPGFHRDRLVQTDGSVKEGLLVQWPDDAATREQGSFLFRDLSGHEQRVPAEQVEVGTFTRVTWAYDDYDFWVVFTAGFTPVPYKLITISAGVFKINLLMFLIASTVSRSARFFLVAGFMGRYGDPVRGVLERYFNTACILFVVLLIGGFVVVQYIVR